jgi:exopolysaccharide biosynthesis polyprenyl glycosylphosphotransferase
MGPSGKPPPPTALASSSPAAGAGRQNIARRLRLRLQEHKMLLAAGDLICANVALGLTLGLRENLSLGPLRLVEHLPWFGLLSLLWIVLSLAMDVYDVSRAASAPSSIWAVTGTALITFAVFLSVPFLSPVLPTHRVELFSFPVLSISGLALWRGLYALMLSRTQFHHRVVILGAGWCGRTLLECMVGRGARAGEKERRVSYDVLGFVDDDPRKQGALVQGVPVLGTHRDLERLVRDLEPEELVFAITHTQNVPQSLFDAVLRCREAGLSVTTMASVYEELTGRVPVQHAGRALDVVMPIARPALYRLFLLAKRLVDIGIGLVGCLLLLLVIPFVWLANRVACPGSLLFIQERVGQGGKVFRLVKLRSMVMDAEKKTGAVWAKEGDRRITPVGTVLRKTRIDEAPQFWNVLRGEMSVVGPRPERPEFVNRLAEEIPFYRARHAVKPGITGWAQVKYRYGASDEDALIKLEYDLHYIKHQGMFADVIILLQTLQVMLGLKGR